MRVSVVIPAWNGRADVERCLASLLGHTTSAELELIVVDNASSDGTAAMVQARFPDARVIGNAENLGFARACNQGMAAATGDLILLLNSDTYVTDDVVGRAARRLSERTDVAMLGCEVRYPDGRRQHTANRRLGIRRSLVERLWLYRLLPHARRAEYLLGGYWEGLREIEVDWLAGAFMLVTPEAFRATGGFDERFFMYGEDSEWCMRLRRAGHRILYAPQVGVLYHAGSVSSDLVWTERDRLERCYRGGVEAYAALHGRLRARAYVAAELAGTTVRWLAYAAAARLRGGEYFASQARFYGWLARFYAAGTVRRGSPDDGRMAQ
jgi:GT2 family glycosyltransferase